MHLTRGEVEASTVIRLRFTIDHDSVEGRIHEEPAQRALVQRHEPADAGLDRVRQDRVDERAQRLRGAGQADGRRIGLVAGGNLHARAITGVDARTVRRVPGDPATRRQARETAARIERRGDEVPVEVAQRVVARADDQGEVGAKRDLVLHEHTAVLRRLALVLLQRGAADAAGTEVVELDRTVLVGDIAADPQSVPHARGREACSPR